MARSKSSTKSAGKREIGVIGLGNMGGNIATKLHESGHPLVLYNKTKDRYLLFEGKEGIHLSKDVKDFAQKLGSTGMPAIVWVMVPGGDTTNQLMSELSTLLRKDDIVIDASNSLYTESMQNYDTLKRKGIYYLDVGCAGGPEDVLKGVSLMVGGDKAAFESAADVFRLVAGNGTYGYLGGSGSGHMAKLVTNEIFYAIFPAFAEGVELLMGMSEKQPRMNLNVNEALRLMTSSPHINGEIMREISLAVKEGTLPSPAPVLKVSDPVRWGADNAANVGVDFRVIKAVLELYPKMSEKSRSIYAAAKKTITGH